MITDYAVLEHPDSTGLATKVKELIKHGWQPLGGVAIVKVFSPANTEIRLYAQAMVKDLASQRVGHFKSDVPPLSAEEIREAENQGHKELLRHHLNP